MSAGGRMPLSLLLASSWVTEFSAQEIAEQIEHNLDFLAVEWADLPERQRSLRGHLNIPGICSALLNSRH